jgi:tRNA-modifying protein YgfZ
MPVSLPLPQLLQIQGRDAIAFAQAQFCNDIALLAVGDWQWNAWLDVQGRVRNFFAVARTDEHCLLLILRGGDAAAFAAELKRFVFRAQVSLITLDRWKAQGWSGSAQIGEFFSARSAAQPGVQRIYSDATTIAVAMPGSQERLLVLQAPASEIEAFNGPLEDNVDKWRAADIAAGLVEIQGDHASRFLPQALGFEAIAAISFAKGCYPGQEVMARLHFKGGNKRSLYQVEFGTDARVTEGSEIATIEDPSQQVGFLLNFSKPAGIGLASMRDNAAASALVLISEPSTQLNVVSRF